MRKLFSVLPLLSVGFPVSVGAQTMFGLVDLNQTTIEKPIQVYGKAKFKNSQVNQIAEIKGVLLAEHTRFADDIKINGSGSVLDHSEVSGDVHVTHYFGPPKIELKHSTVNGQIIFHSLQEGSVIMDPESNVKQGIKNGVKHD